MDIQGDNGLLLQLCLQQAPACSYLPSYLPFSRSLNPSILSLNLSQTIAVDPSWTYTDIPTLTFMV